MIFFQETTTIKSTFLVAFVPKILQHASVQWLENSSLLFPSPASLLTFHFVSRFPLLFPTTKQIDPDLHACLTLFTSVSCPWQQKLVTAASVSPRVHWGLQLSPRNWESSHNSFFLFFIQSSGSCRVCSVAIIPREMEEISDFPW